MINTQIDEWPEMNQKLQVCEFTRLKQLIKREEITEISTQCDELRAALPQPAAIDILTFSFGLSGFERDLLLLTAGVEMDSELAELCEHQQRNGQLVGGVNFGMALSVLSDPHWSALTPMSPLRRWRLIELSNSHSLTSAQLHVDERILHFIATLNYLDPRLKSLLTEIEAPYLIAKTHLDIVAELRSSINRNPRTMPVILLSGADCDAQHDIAAMFASELGLRCFSIFAEDLPENKAELELFATLWQREVLLQPACLLVNTHVSEISRAVQNMLHGLSGIRFVACRVPAAINCKTLVFEVNKPDTSEQKTLWQHALGNAAVKLNGGLDLVSSQFRLSARRIAQNSETLLSDPDKLCEDDDANLENRIWQSCLYGDRPRLEDLAQRIVPRAGWQDLILPESEKTILRQIAMHSRHRYQVFHQWGLARKSNHGLGLSALFSGESGTGKTMAAEVLANELKLDLYRVDLSAVVSKYIGETEKNLRRVFDAADDSGVILLFDEADALFGKRSEVKDSHDRYANIEVSYLLQRMEAYRGLAILTTNLKSGLDTAFHRRLRFVVQFPFPDQIQREAIWRSMMPDSLPVDSLDFTKLARLQFTGGNIRNVLMNAAFFAAEDNSALGMRHLLQSAHIEAAKRERPLVDAEIRGWQ